MIGPLSYPSQISSVLRCDHLIASFSVHFLGINFFLLPLSLLNLSSCL